MHAGSERGIHKRFVDRNVPPGEAICTDVMEKALV
jgi:hypothetical protein